VPHGLAIPATIPLKPIARLHGLERLHHQIWMDEQLEWAQVVGRCVSPDPPRAAYSTTAGELSLQTSHLLEASEAEWPTAVAYAEAAISREHTMWLASRTAAGM
jgi:hypothetical protein